MKSEQVRTLTQHALERDQVRRAAQFDGVANATAPRTPFEHVTDAIEALRYARMCLVVAGAKRAAAKVRRALKSAEGARRHAALAPFRGARQERARENRLRDARHRAIAVTGER